MTCRVRLPCRVARHRADVSNDNNNNSAIEFGLIGIPEAFFISKDSKIKNKIIGPFNENALKIALEQIRF